MKKQIKKTGIKDKGLWNSQSQKSEQNERISCNAFFLTAYPQQITLTQLKKAIRKPAPGGRKKSDRKL